MQLLEKDFQRIAAYVKGRYGINLDAKKTLIESRLFGAVTALGLKSYREYTELVLSQPEGKDCQDMINRLTTNYSFFFRDTHYLEHLVHEALPKPRAKGRAVTVWCAACAEGQEPFSVAMVLWQALCSSVKAPGFSITATDINSEVLKKARQGRYSKAEAERIPPPYRGLIRLQKDGGFEVAPALLDTISWKQQNLLDGSCPTELFDIVFCRNVLIYFNAATKALITEKLYNSVRNGGYLYTGAAETLDLSRRFFRYIAPSIYRKEAAL